MIIKLKLLLFHHEIYCRLFKYSEFPGNDNKYLYHHLIDEIKSEILNEVGDNKAQSIYRGYLNEKFNEINSLNYSDSDKKIKYNYYFVFLESDHIAYKRYAMIKNKLTNDCHSYNNYHDLRSKNNIYVIGNWYNWYYEFLSNFFVKKSILFILGFIIFITFVLNIISNTTAIENSISEHGMISNMVDLHSSFAITVKLLVTLNFFFCFVLFCFWVASISIINYKIIMQNKIALNLGQFYFALYIINLLYSLYFVFTGFVWAEFTWGGKIWQFESKMIQLCVHIFLNLLFCYVFFFYRKNSFFFILNLVLITSIISFIFFYLYGNIEQTYSVHQNTDSLHLFLRFVGAGTSYYVIVFVVYLFYLAITYLVMRYEYLQLIIQNPAIRFYSKFIN